MVDGTWYNPTICLKFHGYSFGNVFKTRIKDRYYLRYAIDTYGNQKTLTGPDNEISGGERNFQVLHKHRPLNPSVIH